MNVCISQNLRWDMIAPCLRSDPVPVNLVWSCLDESSGSSFAV
jgi:hypothetical protein